MAYNGVDWPRPISGTIQRKCAWLPAEGRPKLAVAMLPAGVAVHKLRGGSGIGGLHGNDKRSETEILPSLEIDSPYLVLLVVGRLVRSCI